MKNLNLNKNKLFIITILVILVVGMTLLGVFGFNRSVDYSKSYELTVSIDQNSGNATEILKDQTDAFLAENGLKSKGVIQDLDEGKSLVYKFSSNVLDSIEDLDGFITDKLTAEGLTTVSVDVSFNETVERSSFGAWWVIIALGVALVASFIYVIIMDKLAVSVATVFASLCATILFIALLAITRIPATPFIGVMMAVSAIVASVFSVTTLRRYKDEWKNSENEKLSASELIEKLAPAIKVKYVIASALILLGAVQLFAIFSPSLMIAGGQFLIAGISGIFSASLGAPLIWSAIKDSKTK